MATGAAERYIPALRFRSLTRLYDPCVAATTREGAFKRRVLQRAMLLSGERVLDLACGTGTLAVAATREAPGVEVTGVDGDPEILERARAKAASAKARISFDEGLSTDLPYQSGHFDAVLSTLFFHHLTDDAKRRSAEEARRVIRAGGRIVLADFGRAQDPLMRAAFLWIQVFDGFESTSSNVAGELPDILSEAGFEPVKVTDRFRALFGTIEVLTAGVP
jgi:ubiquinone/menaquinone biosynthesis C-methylase UbiE